MRQRFVIHHSSFIIFLLLAVCACASGVMAQTVPVQSQGTADVSGITTRIDAASQRLDAASQRLDTIEAKLFPTTPTPTDPVLLVLQDRVSTLEKRHPCCVSIEDWGCKLNDPAFDNGPLLTAGFANSGIKAGNSNLEIYFPGGAIWCQTPVETPKRTGIAIRGNGLTYGLSDVAYWGKSQRGGAVSRLVYVGPADKPALTLNGNGTRMDGLVIQRGDYPEPRTEPVRDGSVGLCIAGGQASTGVNTGHHWFPTLAIFGFDTAIDAPNAPVGQHADNCHFGDVQIQNCNRAIHLQNPQANHWRFDFLQCSFTVETVLEIDGAPPVGAPGDISFGMLHLDSIALVFKINQRSSHNPGLTVDFLDVDNWCAGWRLIDAPTTGPLQLKVWGNVGKQVQAGPNPVKLNDDRSQTTLDINITQNGARLPW